MLMKMICPQCGAQLEMDVTDSFMYCKYCGTRIENVAQKIEIKQDVNVNYGGTVIHKHDRSGEPNLYISYTSVNPQVSMVIRLVSTNQKTTVISGQKLSFRLLPGNHVIVLKIGKINYNRTVYIPENNEPVNIYASWNGRAQITIDQPQPETQVNTTPIASLKTVGVNTVNDQNSMHHTVLGIVGFIFSVLMITAPVGMVLCLIDLIKKEPGKKKGLSIAGLVVGVVVVFALIISLFTKGQSVA